MNAVKITYWITTTLVCAMMSLSVFLYFTSPDLPAAFMHLGFPDWFRVELGIAKLLGLIVLILPMIPARIKEWAYVGFFINFFSAFLAHFQSGDPVKEQFMPLLLLALLITSYITFHKMKVIKIF
jgi:DoxX-like family